MRLAGLFLCDFLSPQRATCDRHFDPQFSKTFQPLPIKHSTAICLEELSRWVVLILLAIASFRELTCRLRHHKKKRVISNVAQLGLFHRVGKKKRFRVLRESAIVSARRFVILVGSWQYHHQIMTTSSSCHVTSMQFCWVGLMEGDFALQALIEWEVLICTCKPILQSFLHNLNGMCFDCLCGGEDKNFYRNEVECGVGWGSCR